MTSSDNPIPIDLPPDFEAALAAESALVEYFNRLPPSHRREHLKWIEEAKKPETRARRIEKAMEFMREKAKLRG